MDHIVATCTKCHKQFNILKREQTFLKEKELPNPTQCPSCRQLRRLTLRGSSRQLYKAACSKCGQQIIVAFDPVKVTNPILCRKDYDAYFEENDSIINDPLPDLTS